MRFLPVGFALMVGTLLYLALPSAHSQPQPQKSADWFCTADGVIACFEVRNIAILVPKERYLTVPSAEWVQMSINDWARFLEEQREFLSPDILRAPYSSTDPRAAVSSSSRISPE